VLAASTNPSTADDSICCRQGMTGALQRGVKKLDVGRVHKFRWEHVRKFGICARSELAIGHNVRGHSELGAFGPGGAIEP